MEKIKAFYYSGAYYLYPEKYPEYDSFYKYIENEKAASVVELLQNKCMAPHFVKGESRKTDMFISEANLIIPCDVCLYERAEYDELLREKVRQICPGCLRYGGDAEDLTGHHEEMTIDGKCFFREEGKPNYVLTYGIEAFWKAFCEDEKRLRGLIKQGRIKEAGENIALIAGRTLSSSLFSMYKVNRAFGGKPVLMMSAQGSDDFMFLNEFVLARAPERIKKAWKLLPYLDKRYYSYEPAEERLPDLSKLGLGLEYYPVDADRPRFNIKVYLPESDIDDMSPELNAYHYLSSVIGENVLAAANANIEMIRSSDYIMHKKPEALAKAIKRLYISPLFAPYLRSCNVNDIILVEKAQVEELPGQVFARTKAMRLMLEFTGREKNDSLVRAFSSDLTLAIAYTSFKLGEEKLKSVPKYLMDEYFDRMEKSGTIAVFGSGVSRKEFTVFYAIANEGQYRLEMYLMKPELERYSARTVIKEAQYPDEAEEEYKSKENAEEAQQE